MTEETQSESRRRVLNSLALATAAAAGVAYVDSKWLRELDVETWSAIGIAAGACAVIALLSVVALHIVGRTTAPVLSRAAARASEAPHAAGARLIASVWFCVFLATTAWSAVWVAETWFASARVRRMAVALLVLAAASLTAVSGDALRRRLTTSLGTQRPRRLIVGVTIAAFVLFAGCGVWLLVPIAQQMELRAALHACGIAGAGALGWVLPAIGGRFPRVSRGWRGVRIAVVMVFVAMLGLGSWGAFQERDERLDLALQLRPILSSHVFGMVRGAPTPFLMPAQPANDKSAVCAPDAVPPRAADVGAADPDAPDIVFITVDALRWDMTSLAGRDRDTTPELARHAADGVVFERAYTPAPITRQAFRGMFTGVRPSLVHPVRPTRSRFGFGFIDAQVTMAEYLQSAGYHTTAFNTARTIFSERDGATDGFDVVDEQPHRLCDANDYCADYVTDEIIAKLRRDNDAPAFMWSHLMEAHGPYSGGPTPKDFGDTFQDEYDAALHFIDGELGRLLDFARSPERRNRTWVILTADHGEGLRHPRKHTGHGMHVHEEEIRVPLLVWGPGVSPRRVSTPVSLLDVLPSMIDMAGLRPPTGLCGETLMPALRGDTVPQRPVLSEFVPDFGRSHFMAAFIRGRVKTIVRPLDQRRELYHLDDDPDEKNDLAESRPDELNAELEALRAYLVARGIDPASYRL